MNVKPSKVPRMTRQERQAQTRAALLAAAAQVFVERGFHGASVEAIAAEAGARTRGAFYSNFSSKEELFAELLQERVYSIDRHMAEESATASGRPTPREVGEQWRSRPTPKAGGSFGSGRCGPTPAGTRNSARSPPVSAAGTASTARAIQEAYPEGEEPPLQAEDLATAMIALDIGLVLSTSSTRTRSAWTSTRSSTSCSSAT